SEPHATTPHAPREAPSAEARSRPVPGSARTTAPNPKQESTHSEVAPGGRGVQSNTAGQRSIQDTHTAPPPTTELHRSEAKDYSTSAPHSETKRSPHLTALRNRPGGLNATQPTPTVAAETTSHTAQEPSARVARHHLSNVETQQAHGPRRSEESLAHPHLTASETSPTTTLGTRNTLQSAQPDLVQHQTESPPHSIEQYSPRHAEQRSAHTSAGQSESSGAVEIPRDMPARTQSIAAPTLGEAVAAAAQLAASTEQPAPHVTAHSHHTKAPQAVAETTSASLDSTTELSETGGVLAVFSVAGQVLSQKSGRPLAGVLVDGGALGTRRTDIFGGYSFDNIPLGSGYSCSASRHDFECKPSVASGVVSGPVWIEFVALD
ncbi:MAG: hypothetical protein EBZ48_16250, partial [Proteobacteria bacterium]|nr:hypothetical protein [Pseudomonadota bacterium]